MSRFDILPCGTCTNTWIQETGWQAQDTVSCPHCGSERSTDLVSIRGSQDTKAGAAELRSRIEAASADESEIYEQFIDDRGQYGAQLEEVEHQIESFTLDAELMDLKPIGSDRYADLAEHTFAAEDAKFSQWAEEYSGIGEDLFAEDVSLEAPDAALFDAEIREDLDEWASRVDRDELARGEVTLTDQQPAAATAVLELSDATVTDLWHELFDSDEVRSALARSLTDLFGGLTPLECYDVLEDYGVPFWIRSHIVDIARGYASDAVSVDGGANPRRVVDEIIAPLPEASMANTADLLAVASLFDGLEDSPAIGVIVRETFVESVRRDQRIDVCDLLSVLADSFDVRLVGSGVTLGTFANSHRSDLPGVSEWCNRNRSGEQFGAVERRVAGTLETGEFGVTLLRELNRATDGILTYSELYALYPGDNDSRVRQLIGDFADDGLLEKFGPRTDRKVELLPAGSRVLELFEQEIAQQRSISDFVSEGGKQQQQGRVNTRTGVGGEDGEAEAAADGTAPYRTRYMSPADHAATAATGQNGGVTLVRGGIDDHANRTRYASYDPKRGEAVVAVRAGEPLPLTTSAALALASPEFVDRALPADRLESIDDPAAIVRDARCIGGASDRALEDGQEFRDTLVEWGEELSDMTTKLNHGEYDGVERAQFRSAIIKSAQGLWGTITHLLDLFDIDVHREIRLPSGLTHDKLAALAESIGYAAAIQSTYNGHFACYRQLFEPRDDKRRASFTAQVDAADPTGSLIGSFVIRGPDVHRLEDLLRNRLESPSEVHEDAPEFGVDIPIRSEPARDAFDGATRRVLSRKGIRTTTAAVSVLHTLVATPHDVARVLHRRLSSEDSREIRPDELRTALRGLDATALLPTLGEADRQTNSAGKIAAALLEADEPLTKAELAERADVSKKTVYNYRDRLEALGVLVVTDEGYRLALSFPTSEERETPVWPAFVDRTFTEAVDALLVDDLPASRYGDPDDPIGGLLFWNGDEPPNPWALLEHDEYGPWAETARRLTNGERTEPAERSLLMGPEIKQQSIDAATSSAAAD